MVVARKQMIEFIAHIIIYVAYGGPALFVLLAIINFYYPFHEYSTGKPPLPKEQSPKEGSSGLPSLAPSDEYKIEDNFGF